MANYRRLLGTVYMQPDKRSFLKISTWKEFSKSSILSDLSCLCVDEMANHIEKAAHFRNIHTRKNKAIV